VVAIVGRPMSVQIQPAQCPQPAGAGDRPDQPLAPPADLRRKRPGALEGRLPPHLACDTAAQSAPPTTRIGASWDRPAQSFSRWRRAVMPCCFLLVDLARGLDNGRPDLPRPIAGIRCGPTVAAEQADLARPGDASLLPDADAATAHRCGASAPPMATALKALATAPAQPPAATARSWPGGARTRAATDLPPPPPAQPGTEPGGRRPAVALRLRTTHLPPAPEVSETANHREREGHRSGALIAVIRPLLHRPNAAERWR